MQRRCRLTHWTLMWTLGMFAPACEDSGDDGGTGADDGTGGDDGGTAGDGGTGGDDGGTGGDDGGTGGGTGGGEGCRRYMTAGTFASPVFSGDMTGSFNVDTLTHEDMVTGEMGGTATVRKYASLADFVQEAAAVGRVRYTSEALTTDFFNSETTLEYDADGRLLSKAIDDLDPGGADNSTTYSEWDTHGRPTQGALNVDKFDCADILVTIAYDDEARKMTETTNVAGGTGTGCEGQEALEAWKVYDEHGNVIEETLGSDPTPDVGTTTVLEMAEVCA